MCVCTHRAVGASGGLLLTKTKMQSLDQGQTQEAISLSLSFRMNNTDMRE